MKCITFLREYQDPRRGRTSFTVPIETNEDKILLANFIASDRMDMFFSNHVCLEKTYMMAHGDGGDLKECLQFLWIDPVSWLAYSWSIHRTFQSLTFAIDTETEKLAFANWVIEHKLGDFRHDDAHIFITELYVPAVGRVHELE